jgi:TonB family protein
MRAYSFVALTVALVAGCATPRHVHTYDVSYPYEAVKNRVQGEVVLQVDVTSDGQASKVEILQSSGHTVLDESAVASVKTWHWPPGEIRRCKIPIKYVLRDK